MTNLSMQFKPEQVETGYAYPVYAKVLVELLKCGACNRIMIDPTNPMWPKYFLLNGKMQAKNADWREVTNPAMRDTDDNIICTECAAAGKAEFLCALCEQTRSSTMVQKEIGYGEGNTDRLCTVCYAGRTAKEWGDKVKELNEAHRYDYD